MTASRSYVPRLSWDDADRLDSLQRTIRGRQEAGTVPTGIDPEAMSAVLDDLIEWIESETDESHDRKAAYLALLRQMGPDNARDAAGVGYQSVAFWQASDPRFAHREIDARYAWRDSLPPMAPSVPIPPGRHGIAPTALAGCHCQECEAALERYDAANARRRQIAGLDPEPGQSVTPT